MSALPILPIHAQQQNPITLSCDGQNKLSRSESKPYPVRNMGIVIKLIEHDVSFEEYVAPIESVTAAEVVFRYVSASYSFGWQPSHAALFKNESP
jgi:hypothetical protein